MTGVLQTEFEFTLPNGYADDEGAVHREGAMRLATAADEIKPTTDPRVQSNPAYMTVIILSRGITDLGDLNTVTPQVVENLFVSDLEYLQEMYERINDGGRNAVEGTCPDCGAAVSVEVATDGGQTRHGLDGLTDDGVDSGNDDRAGPTNRRP